MQSGLSVQHEEKAHFLDQETQSSGLSLGQLGGMRLFNLFKEGGLARSPARLHLSVI